MLERQFVLHLNYLELKLEQPYICTGFQTHCESCGRLGREGPCCKKWPAGRTVTLALLCWPASSSDPRTQMFCCALCTPEAVPAPVLESLLASASSGLGKLACCSKSCRMVDLSNDVEQALICIAKCPDMSCMIPV